MNLSEDDDMNLLVTQMHWGSIDDVQAGTLLKYEENWFLRIEETRSGNNAICLTGDRAGFAQMLYGDGVFYLGCKWAIEAEIPTDIVRRSSMKHGDLVLTPDSPVFCAESGRGDVLLVDLQGSLMALSGSNVDVLAPVIPSWTAIAVGDGRKLCELFKGGKQ